MVVMHRVIVLSLLSVVYYTITVYGLVTFEAGILMSTVLLFGIPAYVLARFSLAPAPVLLAVTLFGAALAILLESVAHIYGLWLTVGVNETRLFSLVPVETIIALAMQAVFLVLLYETLFDDGRYGSIRPHQRWGLFGLFTIAVAGLVAMHVYIFDGWLFTHSYLWLLGILVASGLSILIAHRRRIILFLDRFVFFASVAALPLLASLFVSVTNVHKVFALESAYVHMVSIGNVAVPLEELLLAFVIPFLIAVVYEVYLDDQC